MSAPHLLATSVDGDRVTIEGEDARHAVRVLRLREGEQVTVGDGRGNLIAGVITAVSRSVIVDVLGRTTVEASRPLVRVVQAIPKGAKFDQIVKELTQVGVDEIVPIHTARSIARWEGSHRMDRVRSIAWEAAKQSHRVWLPRVSEPTELRDLAFDGLSIVLHEETQARLSTVLPEAPPGSVTLLVGPEGGFATEEIDALIEEGVVVAGLGPLILRTEVAGTIAAALVRGRYGLLG